MTPPRSETINSASAIPALTRWVRFAPGRGHGCSFSAVLLVVSAADRPL